MTNRDDQILANLHILLVEDEYLIASELERVIQEEGAFVVGPVPVLSWATELVEKAERIDGAIVDVNLGGQMTFNLIDTLTMAGIPLVLATGYEPSMIPEPYRHLPRCGKPIDPKDIVSTLAAQMAGQPQPQPRPGAVADTIASRSKLID